LGSAPSCRTGGGEALRRLKLDTSTPVRVSPRPPRANSVAAIAGRWPRRTDGCVNFSWCGLLTEGTGFVNGFSSRFARLIPRDLRWLLRSPVRVSTERNKRNEIVHQTHDPCLTGQLRFRCSHRITRTLSAGALRGWRPGNDFRATIWHRWQPSSPLPIPRLAN